MQTIEAREIREGNIIKGRTDRLAKVLYANRNLSAEPEHGVELTVAYKDTGEVKKLTLDIHKIIKLVRLA